MNNPKLEKISIDLAGRMNDKYTSADVLVAGDTDGTIYTAADRLRYINRAMFKLFNDVWQKTSGNKQMFAGVFPELVQMRTITTSSASAYPIATPNLDYFQLLEAVVDGKQAEIMPSHLYLTVKSGRTLQVKGSTSIPVVTEINGTIYFLPNDAAFQAKSADITFIRQPLDKTQGIYLSMTNGSSGGNTEDSPFLDQWNSKIAEIAEQLCRYDAKE
ncbi:MAG: hypothetical protein ACYC56_11335 [Candidatus Aquicultor sp.]